MIRTGKQKFEKIRVVKNDNISKKHNLRGKRSARHYDRILPN